jgi:hypothetical protein
VASGPRKATVLKQDLPPVIKLTESEYGYLTRYRIISEDRNRFSSWSPVYKVVAFDENSLPEQVSGDISVLGDSVFVTWGDNLARPRYDVFVSEDGGDFYYHGTSPIHTYSFLNSGSSLIDVAIQIESINKQRSGLLTICEISGIIES